LTFPAPNIPDHGDEHRVGRNTKLRAHLGRSAIDPRAEFLDVDSGINGRNAIRIVAEIDHLLPDVMTYREHTIEAAHERTLEKTADSELNVARAVGYRRKSEKESGRQPVIVPCLRRAVDVKNRDLVPAQKAHPPRD